MPRAMARNGRAVARAGRALASTAFPVPCCCGGGGGKCCCLEGFLCECGGGKLCNCGHKLRFELTTTEKHTIADKSDPQFPQQHSAEVTSTYGAVVTRYAVPGFPKCTDTLCQPLPYTVAWKLQTTIPGYTTEQGQLTDPSPSCPSSLWAGRDSPCGVGPHDVLDETFDGLRALLMFGPIQQVWVMFQPTLFGGPAWNNWPAGLPRPFLSPKACSGNVTFPASGSEAAAVWHSSQTCAGGSMSLTLTVTGGNGSKIQSFYTAQWTVAVLEACEPECVVPGTAACTPAECSAFYKGTACKKGVCGLPDEAWFCKDSADVCGGPVVGVVVVTPGGFCYLIDKGVSVPKVPAGEKFLPITGCADPQQGCGSAACQAKSGFYLLAPCAACKGTGRFGMKCELVHQFIAQGCAHYHSGDGCFVPDLSALKEKLPPGVTEVTELAPGGCCVCCEQRAKCLHDEDGMLRLQWVSPGACEPPVVLTSAPASCCCSNKATLSGHREFRQHGFDPAPGQLGPIIQHHVYTVGTLPDGTVLLTFQDLLDPGNNYAENLGPLARCWPRHGDTRLDPVKLGGGQVFYGNATLGTLLLDCERYEYDVEFNCLPGSSLHSFDKGAFKLERNPGSCAQGCGYKRGATTPRGPAGGGGGVGGGCGGCGNKANLGEQL